MCQAHSLDSICCRIENRSFQSLLLMSHRYVSPRCRIIWSGGAEDVIGDDPALLICPSHFAYDNRKTGRALQAVIDLTDPEIELPTTDDFAVRKMSHCLSLDQSTWVRDAQTSLIVRRFAQFVCSSPKQCLVH